MKGQQLPVDKRTVVVGCCATNSADMGKTLQAFRLVSLPPSGGRNSQTCHLATLLPKQLCKKGAQKGKRASEAFGWFARSMQGPNSTVKQGETENALRLCHRKKPKKGDCRSCAAGRGTTGHGGRGGRQGREGREGRDVEARDVRDVRDVTVVRSMKKRVSTQTLGSRDLKDALSELKNKCCVLDGLL